MSGAAVLISGGLDSVVLLAMEQGAGREIWPVHVRVGLAWEQAEAAAIERLLAAPPFAGRIQPLTTIVVDMRDVYPPTHWAVEGRAPEFDKPDEDVYLEGRNITLIAKTSVLCARLGIHRIVLGPLAGNPFPDATPIFFSAMAHAMTLGLDHRIEISAPLSTLHKQDVVRLGVELNVPLEATLSCMSPADGGHCGRCNKCRERQEAFRDADVSDPTRYAAVSRLQADR